MGAWSKYTFMKGRQNFAGGIEEPSLEEMDKK